MEIFKGFSVIALTVIAAIHFSALFSQYDTSVIACFKTIVCILVMVLLVNSICAVVTLKLYNALYIALGSFSEVHRNSNVSYADQSLHQ